MSDELELRNRFVLNHENIETRIEWVWLDAFNQGNERPYDGKDNRSYADWRAVSV